MIRALLIGKEPAAALGYEYVQQLPYDTVVIGSLTLAELLRFQENRVLQALVTQENEGSLGFHQALGYRAVAKLPACGVKFGRWLSVTYLEKRTEIGEIPSIPPVSFLSIVNNDRKFLKILDIL